MELDIELWEDSSGNCEWVEQKSQNYYIQTKLKGLTDKNMIKKTAFKFVDKRDFIKEKGSDEEINILRCWCCEYYEKDMKSLTQSLSSKSCKEKRIRWLKRLHEKFTNNL